MRINQVSYKKIGVDKFGNKRIWMEGKLMAFSSFEKGRAYKTILDVQARWLDLVVDDSGDRKVSGRKRYGYVRLIIELCNYVIHQLHNLWITF